MAFDVGNTLGSVNAGRSKQRHVYDGLMREVAQNPAKLKNALASVLDQAADGDLQALDWIACRLEGKPAQAVTVSGDEDRPLVTLIRMLVVDTNDSNINELRTVSEENTERITSVEQAPPPIPPMVISGDGGVVE